MMGLTLVSLKTHFNGGVSYFSLSKGQSMVVFHPCKGAVSSRQS